MSEESKKSVHLDLNHDEHPGLYRYAIELLNYPELTEEEYAAVMADLKNPEDDPLYLAAQEKLICSHLGMVLSITVCPWKILSESAIMPLSKGFPISNQINKPGFPLICGKLSNAGFTAISKSILHGTGMTRSMLNLSAMIMMNADIWNLSAKSKMP